MLKKAVFLFAYAILIICTLFSENVPSSTGISVPGGYAIWSDPAVFQAPFAIDSRLSLLNPAGLAEFELPQYTLAVGELFPQTANSSMGSTLTFSAAGLYPISSTVFWASIEGIFSPKPLTEFKQSDGISAVAGISKKIGDTFSIGLGLNSSWIVKSGQNWFPGISLGFQKDFSDLGAGGSNLYGALINGGNGSANTYPYTLLSGWKTVILDQSLAVALGIQVASPALTDLWVQPSIALNIGQIAALSIGWNSSLINWEHNSWIPAVSITINGSSWLQFGDLGVIPRIRIQPLSARGIGTETSFTITGGEKDQQGPNIILDAPLQNFYSAKESSLIKFTVTIQDASAIESWEMTLQDESGTVQFHLSETEKKSSTSIRIPIAIPLDSSWADGTYQILLTAQDEKGNKSTENYSFNLDSSPPNASVTIEQFGLSRGSIFSPNGDGRRDLLSIFQTGSKEKEWVGIIMDSAGNQMRRYIWNDMAPSDIVWDGRNDQENLVSDGTYFYQLAATDEAGNSCTVDSGPLYVDRAPRMLRIELSGSALSTDPASIVSHISAHFSDFVETGLLEWTIQVVDSQGLVYKTWKGSRKNLDQFPDLISFNGLTDAKDYIPDGNYRFSVQMEYANGDILLQTSRFFTVQSQKPSGHVRASSNRLDYSHQDGILLYHDLSSDADWRGFITDTDKHIVKTFILGKTSEPIVRWQGDTDSGDLAARGTYYYFAEGVNSVALTGRTDPISLFVEPLKKGSVIIQTNTALFSALSGEGKVLITPRYQDVGTINSYQFSIQNMTTRALVKSDTGTLPGTFSWDGRDSAGLVCPDGSYQAILNLTIDNGSTLRAVSQPIILDSTPPQVSVTAGMPVFSPNDDGNMDTLTFAITAEGTAQWKGTIIDEQGNPIKSISWKDRLPATFVWDGRDDGNTLAQDGLYRLVLEGADPAGNQTKAQSGIVRLDNRSPSASILNDLAIFSPNGDDFADIVNIRLISAFTDGLSHYTVEIRDQSGKTVRRIAEGSTLEQNVLYQWNGKTGPGTGDPVASDGDYTFWAQLHYTKGDILTISSKPIRIDTSPPKISINLTPQPFSPDDDGTNDVLSIFLSAEDASEINGWKLSILDPAGNIFTSFSGKTLPSGVFTWDGYNLNNELIEAAQDYTYIVQVRDVLGNMATQKGTLSTDVFVIRDGDKLKIRISSIVFPPNSANLLSLDRETSEHNKAILDRIAIVLKKYSSYRIRIEGHGVNISGTEREEKTELEALSLARSQAVLEALVERGIERNRLEAHGMGGRYPLVPHDDLTNRWKNRRVEFILMR